MKFRGVFAPATTPFDAETGDVDLVALRRNARVLIGAGVRGLVLFGTTGEGPLLDEAERVLALGAVREIVEETLLLSAISAESTRVALRMVDAAVEAGADAVLVAPPAYYRPQMTPEALREHYLRIADRSRVPVLLYQVPTAYSGVPLAAGLVEQLATHGNVAGIKDSSGDLRGLGSYVEAGGEDFSVLVGSGAIFYGGLQVGAKGGVLGVADIAPRICCELFEALQAGRDDRAGALQELLSPVHREIVATFGVPGVKAALDLLGHAGGDPRSPLRPLRERERGAVRLALTHAGLLSG